MDNRPITFEMRGVATRIVAVLMLVGLGFSGRLSPCFCIADLPESACADHDHSCSEDPVQHERDCSCPTCHVHMCPHVAFVVEQGGSRITVSVAGPRLVSPDTLKLPLTTSEIFTPPKVG